GVRNRASPPADTDGGRGMADEPSDDRFEPGEPAPAGASRSRLPLERSRFGGTERRRAPHPEAAVPASRGDLRRGAGELTGDSGTRTNWGVLAISSGVILAFSIWAIWVPDDARARMKACVGWIALNLGWYYVLTVTLVI